VGYDRREIEGLNLRLFDRSSPFGNEGMNPHQFKFSPESVPEIRSISLGQFLDERGKLDPKGNLDLLRRHSGLQELRIRNPSGARQIRNTRGALQVESDAEEFTPCMPYETEWAVWMVVEHADSY
jgi:hypothetical protein